MRLSFNHLISCAAAALAAVVLTSCGSSSPTPPVMPLTMNYTPALRPFGPVFQTCTRMQSGLSLLVNELSNNQINSLPADILLTWGEAGVTDRTPYETGTEGLVFIVNPSNPVTSITTDQLALILSGQTSTWGALLQPACPECAVDSVDHPLAETSVEIWTYPPGDEILQSLSDIPGGTQIPLYQSRLAPDPEAMRQVVSREYTSLGFIPRRWLDDSVKILEVRGLQTGTDHRSILAYPAEPLSPAASNFISCLQQVLNP
ncbi:MAG: hypothetical protein AB9891_16520 [Anaerolineaceae bacterium]